MAASRILMALAIAATMAVESVMAANYTVGDSAGWELGSDLQSWSSSKNFTVGDVIVFVYSANHNVLEVDEADFASCSASAPLDVHTNGNTAITLLTSGKRSFICGVPGHCLSGMKVQIDVIATSSPPLASPPTIPTSPPPASPPTIPTSPPIVAPSSPRPTPPTKAPVKPPQAPSPGSNASPPAPPVEPTPPSEAPTPDSPIPPFPFNMPLNPAAPPTTPPPPPSSAYKCKIHFSVWFSFVVIMLFAL